MFKEASKGILVLLSKGLKHRKQRNQHRDNYFQQGENPGGRPDPAGMALFLRYSNRGGRRGPRNSLVCSQGHCCGHHSAPGLLPSKASTHPLHSDYDSVVRNAQHFCNKALGFHGVLCAHEQLHLACLAFWHGNGAVGLQVEVLLATDIQLS